MNLTALVGAVTSPASVLLAGLPMQVLPSEGEGFTPPGVKDFQFEGLLGTDWLTKPMVEVVIAAIVTLVLWIWGSRKLKLVPSKGQFLMEQLYNMIRNGVARDVIGPGFRPYIGLLVGLFTFILINNWFGEFFLFMFPTFSNIGYVWGMVAFIYIVYIGAGVKTHGWGYFKMMLVPKGVPWLLYFIIIPVEFVSNFLTRPLTLAVRLFANMFGGHLSIMVFVLGGTYLLTYAGNIALNLAGALSIIFSFAMIGLELFIGFLQAYIFTILAAQYISSSISEAH